MFAYCGNNSVSNADPDGELWILDYFCIHLIIKFYIREERLWDIEVVVYDENGKKGRLDLYDSRNNAFYEVKSYVASQSDATKKQIARYESTVRFQNWPGRDHPKKGMEYKIEGTFIYRNNLVYFFNEESDPWLIKYITSPLDEPEDDDYHHEPAKVRSSERVDYIPMLLPYVPSRGNQNIFTLPSYLYD